MEALLAGAAEPVATLSAALSERGVDARAHPAEGLAGSLTGIEHELERSRPACAVAVGAGEEALALALTAAKAGVPVAQAPAGSGTGGDSDAARAIAALAEFDAGPEPARAADLIATWIGRRQPPSDLD